MNPGTETSLLSNARAGELAFVELSVFSVDQVTGSAVGAGAAKSRELERTTAKMLVARFIGSPTVTALPVDVSTQRNASSEADFVSTI
jgi:hypothetical protein